MEDHFPLACPSYPNRTAQREFLAFSFRGFGPGPIGDQCSVCRELDKPELFNRKLRGKLSAETIKDLLLVVGPAAAGELQSHRIIRRPISPEFGEAQDPAASFRIQAVLPQWTSLDSAAASVFILFRPLRRRN